MTQIQQIEKQFEQVKHGPVIVQFWKKAIAEGRIVEVVNALKIEIRDNRPWVTALLGEIIVQMVEIFNPITEAEIKLAELHELWQAPKDFRRFDEIRTLIKDIEILFKISELSK